MGCPEEQILAYMKYGLLSTTWDELCRAELFRAVKEASLAMGRRLQRYAREAVKAGEGSGTAQ